MGGQIWVESQGNLGGNPPENWLKKTNSQVPGSSFFFTIKLSADSDLINTITPSQVQQNLLPEKKINNSSVNILLVEDNKVNQKVALLTLKKLGYQADVANNGLEALAKLEDKSYELILMDVQMPEMDGLTATQIIRRENQTRPLIIGLTANAFTEDKEKCLAAGMDDYITKPISLAQMEATLAKYLS